MDPFVAIMLGGVGGLVIALLLLGRFYPGSGREVIDWSPTRSPELEAQNEIDDLEQLRELANRRRRRRGEAELSAEGLESQLLGASDTGGEDSEADIAELLELANARRRRKGLSELTLEEYKASLE